MKDDELVTALDGIRGILISVATGGPRIDQEDPRYQRDFASVSKELAKRRIANPIPFKTLWDWHGRWSSGDLPTYRSRRVFVSDVINPLIDQIRTGHADAHLPTGWQRVDRTVGEVRDRLAAARNEEHFQAVGLLCREALISLAEAVYTRERHPPLDGIEPSKTDAKRKLDAYIAVELFGEVNEELRRHARSALALANALQHQRTAEFRDAAMCVEATTATINIIAIIAGQRDPA